MSQIYLEIGDVDSFMEFIKDAKESGFLKDISSDKVKSLLEKKEFPIRVKIELNQVFELLAANPMVKKLFGKKIEDATIKGILKVVNE